jgi:hypothetical protein
MLAKPVMKYLHADSAAHARAQYCAAHPNRRTHQIIGVAPAIGYYVEDTKGEKLSVD